MPTCSVFDLDGVLIDSRRAVREAYYAVGIEMPPDAWGKPWREWLIDACDGDFDEARLVHKRKNDAYYGTLRTYGRRLPLADHVVSLNDAELPVWVITGASHDAAVAALLFLKLDDVPGLLYVYEQTRRGKEQALARIAESYPIGVYYDDQHLIVPPNWVLATVHLKEIKL